MPIDGYTTVELTKEEIDHILAGGIVEKQRKIYCGSCRKDAPMPGANSLKERFQALKQGKRDSIIWDQYGFEVVLAEEEAEPESDSDASLINVDFDKTLTDPDQDEWSPAFEQEPNEKMIEAVREAYIDGKKIVVWTARQWNEAAAVAGWLTAHEVPYHGLMCGKGGADQYVDDKTVTPEEFVGDEEIMRVQT